MRTPDRSPSCARRGASLAAGLLAAIGAVVLVAAVGAVALSRARAGQAVPAQVAAPRPTAPAAPASAAEREAGLRALLGDPARLAQAKAIFLAKCAACHTPTGEGIMGLGPNLTDDFWLHGSDMTDIVDTITDGVPGKAMVAWKGQLSDDEIRSLAVYVVSLKGTGGERAKAPEGERRPIAYWPKP